MNWGSQRCKITHMNILHMQINLLSLRKNLFHELINTNLNRLLFADVFRCRCNCLHEQCFNTILHHRFHTVINPKHVIHADVFDVCKTTFQRRFQTKLRHSLHCILNHSRSNQRSRTLVVRRSHFRFKRANRLFQIFTRRQILQKSTNRSISNASTKLFSIFNHEDALSFRRLQFMIGVKQIFEGFHH